MKQIAKVAMAIAVALTFSTAHAAAYKCVGKDGKVSFSDRPCPMDTAKGEKIMDRGAGFSHLSPDEKRQFNEGVMSNCNGPRDVCACLSDYLAEDLSYEEVMQYAQQRSAPPIALQEKARKAMKYCMANRSK